MRTILFVRERTIVLTMVTNNLQDNDSMPMPFNYKRKITLTSYLV